MRIQNQSIVNQLNSVQRAFAAKQTSAPPVGLRTIDQLLIARQQLNKASQAKPIAAKQVKIARDPVVVNSGSARGSAKPLELPPSKPLETKSDAGVTAAKSDGADADVVNTVPPPPVTDSAPIVAPAETPTQPTQDSGPLTIQGLNAAWGTDNTQYDLNGDGTVNTADLLQFINSMPAQGNPSLGKPLQLTSDIDIDGAATTDDASAVPSLSVASQAQVTTVSAGDPVTAPPTQSELTLDGLMSAWGQADSAYDLNNDGTVNVGDLLQFINNHPKSSGNGEAGEGNGASGPQQPASSVGKPGIGGVTKLADALIDRLMKAGFDSQPPTNIRELVDTFNLPADHSQKLLDRLQQRYPGGLGVNLVA